MRALCCAVAVAILSMPVIAAQGDPVAYWTFDDIRVERKVVEMVRGETFIPKEKFAFVQEEVGGKSRNSTASIMNPWPV